MSSANERLREARKRAGYTSALSAAKRHGWGASTYAAHENGQNAFDAETAKVYAKAFRVSPGWLLTGEQSRPLSDDELEKLQALLRDTFDKLHVDPKLSEALQGIILKCVTAQKLASVPLDEVSSARARFELEIQSANLKFPSTGRRS